MSDKRIEVEFGAKTGEIEAGANNAAKAVEGFSAKAKDAATTSASPWSKLGPLFGEVARSAKDSLAGAGASSLGSFGNAAQNAATEAAGKWGALPPLFQGVATAATGALMAIGTALTIKKVADANASMIESTQDLARALGTTTNEASVLRAALDDVGVTQDEFLGASKGLTRQLKEDEKGLNELGLATRDASGELRPMKDLTLDAIKVMNDHKEGTDRNEASMRLFGRGVDASSKLVMLNAEVIEENRKAVKELNLEVGQASTDARAEFDAASDRSNLVMQAFSNAIGQSVMPVATELTEWFNRIAPAAITAFRGVLSGLSTVFLGLTNGVRILWEVLGAMLTTLSAPMQAFILALTKMASGDFTGAFNAIRGVGQGVVDSWSTAMKNIEESTQKTRDRVGNIWAFALGGNEKEGDSLGNKDGKKTIDRKKKDDKNKPAAVTPPKEAMPESAMPRLQNELDAQRMMFAELNNGRELSKAAELAYWEEVQRTADLTSKDQLAVMKNVSTLKLGIMRDETRVRQQLATDAAAHAQDLALAEVDFEEQSAQLSVQLGETTAEQLLAQQEQFEARRYAIKLAALQNQQAGLDPTLDPVAYAQITAQIEMLEAQHQQNLAGIRGQAAIESSRTMTTMGQSLESGFSGVFAKIGTSIYSIGGLMRGMGQVVLQTFTQMLAQMAAKWLVNKLIMKGISKASALGQVGEEAAKAGAGGVASMASAPFPLNLGAPAFGASMSALAMSFAPLASAAGGYDIPAGVNPLVQTHAKEMILPAKYADVIRGMADGRGESGESDGGSKVVKFYGSPDDTVRASQLPDMLRELGANFEFVRGFR